MTRHADSLTPTPPWVIWAERLPLLGAAAAVVLAALRTITTPDFWGALAAGRAVATHGIVRSDIFTFTSPGAPWCDVRWLYHAILHALWRTGGAPLVLAVKLAAMAGAMALATAPIVRRGGAAAAGLAIALLIAAVAPNADVSAPVLAILPAAVLIAAVRNRPRPLALYGAAVTAQVVWINLDATGVLGPVIAAAGSAALLWDLRHGLWRPPTPRDTAIRLALPLVLAAALLAQPYGVDGLRWIAKHADSFFVAREAAGWPTLAAFAPPSATAWVFYAWMLLCGAGLAIGREGISAFDVALAGLGLVLPLYLPATLPFLPPLAAPFTAHAAGQILAPFRRMPSARPAVGLAAGLASIALAAAVPVRARHADALAIPGLRAEDRHLPAAFAESLKRHHLSPRIFCAPADGAMLSWALPGCSVFADLRTGCDSGHRPVGVDALVADGEAAERRLREQWNVDAVLLNCLVPSAPAIAERWRATGRWELAYFDGVSALLVARGSDAAARTPLAALREDGLRVLKADGAAAARRPGSTGISPRIAGAAIFFLASGHPREAASALELLRTAGIRHPAVDAHLGRAWLAAGSPAAAAEAWQRYTRRRPNDPEGWRRLAESLQAAGRSNEADRIRKKAGIPAPSGP